jgi:hypothetical protein
MEHPEAGLATGFNTPGSSDVRNKNEQFPHRTISAGSPASALRNQRR